jgi:hypothetical protein
MTGTIQMVSKGVNQQVLDKLKVERERGITGKLRRVVRIEVLTDHVSSQGTDCEVGLTGLLSGITLVCTDLVQYVPPTERHALPLEPH